ncbi:hypothetical protein C8R46DRAFT_1131150 [Mycena filopes]|nr:hypothetical protein C8R46DRAFT_1131150 [Mycena filopes]
MYWLPLLLLNHRAAARSAVLSGRYRVPCSHRGGVFEGISITETLLPFESSRSTMRVWDGGFVRRRMYNPGFYGHAEVY